VTLPAVRSARPVSGGSINDAFDAVLADGRRAFVKTRDDAAPGEYAAEAAGLRWLADGGALVPEILEVAEGHLALEWLETGPLGADAEEELGRRLAEMHRSGAERFGATAHGGPLRIGPVELPDDPADAWPAFYAARRLVPLLDRAGLSAAGRRAVERVCERLPELGGPPEPPARLHGDLWTGNVHASGGRPYLIDPAAYGGHREVDLAMLDLFGSVPARTRAAYEEVWPLDPGWRERVALWQLFPLLVHAALFGGSYVASAERVARGYA
jgi:fructosamine-3-kinase